METLQTSSSNPITQPPVPPQSMPLPTTPTVPPQTAPQHTTKHTIFIVLAVLILLILGAASYYGISSLKLNLAGLGPNDNKAAQVSTPETTPSLKYTQDRDSDAIPDILEAEMGFNADISEFVRCQPVSCGPNGQNKTQNATSNILLVIDSSGSMDLQINGTSKMELAKEAIRKFLGSAAANVNIGIAVYGHKGSNSTSQKAVSCASADIIAPLGLVTAASADGYLSQIKPVGWTPIGLAIRKGTEAFAGKEGQKNQMIVVTDGAETCDSNPVAAAQEAKTSTYAVQVDVIGFAVNASEQSSLQAISTSGGGLFSVAINADQLLSQMRANHEKFQNYQANAQCTSSSYQNTVTCLQDVQKKSGDYVTAALTGKIGAEYQELFTLKNAIFTRYSRKIDEVQTEWSNQNKAQQQKLQQ